MTAGEIAAEINANVEAFLRDEKTYDEFSATQRNLWDHARTLGLAQDVDRLLQAQGEREMAEAIQQINAPLGS